MTRILIINQNWMGDVLFSTPAIRAIRKKFPNAFISCLVPERAADVLRHNPRLNEVLIYNERASLVSFMEPLRVFGLLSKRQFDSVFMFHRSRSKSFLCKLAGIRTRIGYERKGQKFLTQAVPLPPQPLHKTDYFLNLVEAAEIPADGRVPDFEVTQDEIESLDKKLAGKGVARGENFIVIHPGGNWNLKRWPVAHFFRLLELFFKQTPWKAVVCGARSEKGLADEIVARFSDGRAVSLSGETSLGELAALLKRARFLVSNDSGPIHLAASQKTKILGLFGPTSRELTGPISDGPVRILSKDVGCRVPCYFHDCDYRVCMELITPEEVFTACRDWCC